MMFVRFLVLTFAGGAYVERGVFDREAHASSGILDGFDVAVDQVLRAGESA